MRTSKIEWTDKTWNPITGCTPVSEGCRNCYAKTMAKRIHAMGLDKYKNDFELTLHERCLDEPKRWKKPHMIFVCSMSDLFHESVPFSFIDKVMQTIESTPYHKYQILTKRAKRMSDYFSNRSIPNNIWLGVTVESKSNLDRIEHLRYLDVGVRFLSCEPLLEDLGDVNLDNIDWIIVGGESGHKARPMKPEWMLSIKKQAKNKNTHFFFKQWGTWGADGVKRSKKANGKMINGKVVQEMPE